MSVYEIVLKMVAANGEMLNVLHYDFTGVEPVDWQAVVDLIASDFTTHLSPIIAPAVTFEGINVRLDSPGQIGVFYTPTAGSVAGSATDNQWAGGLAAQVYKRSTSGSRPALGWVKVGGITSEGLGAGGRWTATVQTALFDFWNDMLTLSAAGPSTGTLQIKARNPSAPNTVPYNPVITVDVNPIPKTQRTRVEGNGS